MADSSQSTAWPPPDLSVVIPGRMRSELAEAILDASIRYDEEARLKRRGSPGQRRLVERAGELRTFSNGIRP